LLAEKDVYVHALTDRAAVLATVRPSFIVVHDPDAAFIREIEMHAAHRPGARMRVYFMVHDTSVEEQRYLSQIRYESDSFANLIRGKAHAAMPFEQEGRVYNATPLAIAGTSGASAAPVLPLPQLAPLVDPKALAASRNTRQRGGQLSVPTKLHVVVDIREFMSSLPSILHQSGFKVMPCTLEVGDYVLSPSMCVERKSLPDLIESLRNGRLVTQMQNMCRHYKIPILLIEFERDKAFGIQNPADVPKDLNYNTTQGRLAMLVMRFPKMRIMWSRSLHMTAKMFADWKYAEEEPTIEVASKVGVPQGGSGEPGAVNHAVNQAAIDMLRRLPGVTDSNYRRVMTAPGITCLADLADVTMERLQEILGDPRQGRTLYEFLHAQYPVHMMGGGR
jgi:DNA excision repair protein ERCC-4